MRYFKNKLEFIDRKFRWNDNALVPKVQNMQLTFQLW